jgi:N-acetylglucosamine malate deacetylase 1
MNVPAQALPQRILVISPHPDDESIGCGGTLRRHVVSGDEVRAIFLTSGERGGHSLSPPDASRVREEEAQQACRILGLAEWDFWRQPDGKLEVTDLLARRLAELLDQWRPHLIYVTHEQEMHTDHRAAASLVRRVVAGVRGAPTPQVMMYEVWTPLQEMDEIIDITDHLDTKIAAVQAHRSQCNVLRFDEAVRGLNRFRGEMHSWPGGDYAEVFKRMLF